ncbi:MAG: DUF202 domain-containing protein [Methylophilaceae bacterium]
MANQPDPRIFFAAERTLLAWLRTGLTIIGIGFVISRFGLFVQLFATQSLSTALATSTSISAALGIAFVLIGSLAIGSAAIQHRRFVATLTEANLPPAYASEFAFILSSIIAALGMALAAYLWYA